MSKEELQAEAALILEQEGWLLARLIHDEWLCPTSRRLRQFSDRYRAWQQKVDALRASNPAAWPNPLANS